MSENELRDAAKGIFDEFDEDGSGSIDNDELGKVFDALGSHKTEEELKEIVD
jgi:Ca2+-binding EF-hand superfamily protein